MKFVLSFRAYLLTVILVLSTAVLLQAEVTLKQSRTTLQIRGDSNGDTVLIAGIDWDEVWVVVNGGLPSVFTDARNIKINMGKGADVVIISSILISGNLEINMGGDMGDEVDMYGSSVGGHVSVKGASHHYVYNCNIGRDLALQSGFPLNLYNTGYTTSVELVIVGGKVTFRGNSKLSDAVRVRNSSISGNVDVRLGGGETDELFIQNTLIGGNASFDGGKGSLDLLSVFTSMIVGRYSDKNFEYYGL